MPSWPWPLLVSLGNYVISCVIKSLASSFISTIDLLNHPCLSSKFRSLLQVYVCGCLFMGLVFGILFLEHSPPLYHAYTAMTVFLWTQIFGEYRFLKGLWRYLHGRVSYFAYKLLATAAISIFILEFLVWLTESAVQLSPLTQCKLREGYSKWSWVFEMLSYAGAKLHWQEDLHLVLLDSRCHCFTLSVLLNSVEI